MELFSVLAQVGAVVGLFIYFNESNKTIIGFLRDDVKSVKDDIRSVSNQVATLSIDVREVKTSITHLHGVLSDIDYELKSLNTKVHDVHERAEGDR